MRDELATVVFPVLVQGLNLKDQLDCGLQPDLDEEQAKLKGLLNAQPDVRRTEYVGESAAERSVLSVSASTDATRRGGEAFLGIRYGLVCWLDEMFSVENAWNGWGNRWNERKLETALYGTNERAWRFWEQARKAEGRPGGDALEAFYLCVMLGFRGDRRDDPEKLHNWFNANKDRVARAQNVEWPMPAELEAPANVPPLHGREKMQKMVMIGGIFLLAILPVVTLFIILQF